MVTAVRRFLILGVLAGTAVSSFEGTLWAEKPAQEKFSSTKPDEIRQINRAKFAALKKYNLPLGQYAIMGSGPLGIRGLRVINDIDIIVTPELRDSLAAKFGVTDNGEVRKIVFPDDDIEAFWEGSFYTRPEEEGVPTTAEMIAQAEVIDGLPFQTLDHVLYFKRRMKRDKDLKDVMLIEEWQKAQKAQRTK